jgi:hypothetical protein
MSFRSMLKRKVAFGVTLAAVASHTAQANSFRVERGLVRNFTGGGGGYHGAARVTWFDLQAFRGATSEDLPVRSGSCLSGDDVGLGGMQS